jgi:hypothetical protein
MNQKKYTPPQWRIVAQARAEANRVQADRIEELMEQRRAARRLAHEMFLIQARAAQNEREKKQKEQFNREERLAWDETMMQIQLIYQAYGFGD